MRLGIRPRRRVVALAAPRLADRASAGRPHDLPRRHRRRLLRRLQPGRLLEQVRARSPTATAYGAGGRLRHAPPHRPRTLPAIAYAQLVTDQITWTAIVYISGGATSGATSLYGLTCLVRRDPPRRARRARRGAVGARAATSLLCVAFWQHVLPAPADQQVDVRDAAGRDGVSALRQPPRHRGRSRCSRATWPSACARPAATSRSATARAEQAERLALLGRARRRARARNPKPARLDRRLDRAPAHRARRSRAEDQQLCEIVERETARLNDLVGDMLDLSRPRAPSKVAIDLGRRPRATW